MTEKAAPPTASATFISLAGLEPVGEGRKRRVYVHPHDPGLLIKVVRPGLPKKSAFVLRRRRWGRLRNTAREVREFLALQATSPKDVRLIEFIHGFCETDLGLGLVVEALRTENGELAPALSTILQQSRFTPDVKAALDRFLDDLESSEIILGDFTADNLVYAHDRATKLSRFVLVDGIGEKLFIPLNTISPWFRKWNRRRQIRRLRNDIENSGAAAYSAATRPAIT